MLCCVVCVSCVVCPYLNGFFLCPKQEVSTKVIQERERKKGFFPGCLLLFVFFSFVTWSWHFVKFRNKSSLQKYKGFEKDKNICFFTNRKKSNFFPEKKKKLKNRNKTCLAEKIKPNRNTFTIHTCGGIPFKRTHIHTHTN